MNAGNIHIVKVRKPLVPNRFDAPWLVHARGREKLREIPDFRIPWRVRTAMGDDPEAYFRASWLPPHGWTLHERVDDQEW